MAKSKKMARKVKTTKRAAGKTIYTFVVLQGITPQIKKALFAKAKRKELSFSAWARAALVAAK